MNHSSTKIEVSVPSKLGENNSSSISVPSPVSANSVQKISELKLKIKRKNSFRNTRQIKHEIVIAQNGLHNSNNGKTTSIKENQNGISPSDVNFYSLVKRRKSESKHISTKDVGNNTVSMATMTDPNLLGPCDAGTSVTLSGIVWLETDTGILVVNVKWRGRAYVGTLMDASKHDYAPINVQDYVSPIEPFNQSKRRGKKNGKSRFSWTPRKSKAPVRSSSSNMHSPHHVHVHSKTEDGHDHPIVCPHHQTCFKRFSSVTALRYHLATKEFRRRRDSASNDHDQGLFKSPASPLIQRVKNYSASANKSECNSPVKSPVLKSVSVTNYVESSIDSSDSKNPSSLTTSSYLGSHPVSLSSSYVSSSQLQTSSQNSISVPHFNMSHHNRQEVPLAMSTSILSTEKTTVSRSFTTSSDYLIDGISPISSASSSAHESPVDKRTIPSIPFPHCPPTDLARQRSLSSSGSLPPDIVCSSVPCIPSSSHSTSFNVDNVAPASPAYSDISDSNDYLAPVLEEERPELTPVPLTPPFLTQPPPLLPGDLKHVVTTSSLHHSVSSNNGSIDNISLKQQNVENQDRMHLQNKFQLNCIPSTPVQKHVPYFASSMLQHSINLSSSSSPSSSPHLSSSGHRPSISSYSPNLVAHHMINSNSALNLSSPKSTKSSPRCNNQESVQPQRSFGSPLVDSIRPSPSHNMFSHPNSTNIRLNHSPQPQYRNPPEARFDQAAFAELLSGFKSESDKANPQYQKQLHNMYQRK